MNLVLLLGVWIMALCFLIGGINKLSLSEADYEEVKVTYEYGIHDKAWSFDINDSN